MVYILLGTGFEELEVIAPADILRRGGVEVKLVALAGTRVTGAHGMELTADGTLSQADAEKAEGVIVPGGMGGVNAIASCAEAGEFIRAVAAKGGYVAAICAGPTVLAGLGLLEGKKATCYPGLEGELTGAEAVYGEKVVVDGKTVTSRAPGTAVAFGLKLLELLKDEETRRNVAEAMCL